MFRKLGLAIAMQFEATSYAWCWERDVHYGLTKWLALQAGYSDADAMATAKADQSLDEGHYTAAPWAVAVHVIFDNDEQASKEMRRWHFPTYASVPGPAASRAVRHNSAAARRGVEDTTKAHKGEPLNSSIEEFGMQLHPFQDSWSHEGIPDIPCRPFIQFRPRYTWAHPEKRGSWATHDADITSLHVKDITDGTAPETLALMETFAKNHQRTSSSIKYKDIEPEVLSFACADNKMAKRDWFVSHGFSNSEAARLVADLSIPDREEWSFPADPACGRPRLPSVSNSNPTGVSGPSASPLRVSLTVDIPYGFQSAVERFLQAWIVDKDVDRALELVDVGEIGRQLAPYSKDPKAWISRVLTMWLVEDHGLVNRMGHGMPDSRGYEALPMTPKAADLENEIRQLNLTTISPKSLNEAIEGSREGTKYDVFTVDERSLRVPASYAVAFHFRHTPNDAIILLFSDFGGPPRLVRFLWVTT